MDIFNTNSFRIFLLIILCIIAFMGGIYYCKSNKKEHFTIGGDSSVQSLLDKRNMMKSRQVGNGGICVPSLNNRYRQIRYNNNNCKDICSKYSDCVGYTTSSEGKTIDVSTNNNICSNICFSGVKDKVPSNSLCVGANTIKDNKKQDCHTKYYGELNCNCKSSPSCHVFINEGYSRQLFRGNQESVVINNPSVYSGEICNTSSGIANTSGLQNLHALQPFPPVLQESQDCGADYDKTTRCCGQTDKGYGQISPDYICPITAPTCSGYIHGKQWGKCISN